MLTLILSLLFFQSAVQSEGAFERIQTLVAVSPVTGDQTTLAGVYVNPPRELRNSLDMNGVRTSLYLFPDGTYLFVQRSSLLPMTIFDKGTWVLSSEGVELKSTHDITWNPDLERRLLLIRRASHSDEVLLIGKQMAVKRFEMLAKNGAATALLTVSRQRSKTLTPKHATRIKDYLIRNAWHPERFGAIPSTTF